MPMTAAEKQKKYREKLKNELPQKYEEMQRKAKERSAKYYEKKKSTYTEEDKQKLRQKWKEDRKKAKDNMALPNKPTSKQDDSLICRKIIHRMKQENSQLRLQVDTLSKGFKSLKKKIARQQTKFDKMQKDYENVIQKLTMVHETNDVREPEEITPRKKVTDFINKTIPNIETPKKDEIKNKLLQHNILTESLKLNYKTGNNAEKKVIRKVLNDDIVKKYKHKTKITDSLGIKTHSKRYLSPQTKTTSLQKKIERFYNRDDVSRATAGKKEYRTFKKVTRQKRYLLDKLSVLHRKFIEEEGPISFSTFKKYRPFYVLSPKIRDCETCACIKHCNMQFLVDGLKSLKILKTDNLNEVTADLVCDFNSKDCMYNNCNTCSEIKLNVDNEKLLEEASWYFWVLKEHEYYKGGEKKKYKKMVKIKKEGTVQELLWLFTSEMKKFKTHVFNFYFQYKKYKDCINNLKEYEICLHIDFSENFTCKYHKEIQAMHFIKEQITLHTGVFYIKGEEKPVSFCSISPDNQHNPEAIWSHLDPILQHIRNNYPNISAIHFFSDGPTTQYRQKKNFYLFSEKIYEYGFSYGTWSFFEAAHGKGAADGIGGVIKRTLDAKIARGIDIPNAETAFDVLNAEGTVIKLFYIPSIKQPIHTKLSPLPQTMKIHQLITTEKLKLKYRCLSCFCGDPRGNCECHSPAYHNFYPTTSVNEHLNQQFRKIKENKVISSKNSKKTRQRRISSSTEEDDDEIEYAESDATDVLSDDAISPYFNDDDDNLTEELDENTGILKRKVDPNKKITILSDINLKIDTQIHSKQGKNKRKSSENENLTQKRSRTDHNIPSNTAYVTMLSQVQNTPENMSSADLRNIFKDYYIIEVQDKDNHKLMTENLKIHENKENEHTEEDITKTLNKEEKDKIEIENIKEDKNKNFTNYTEEENIEEPIKRGEVQKKNLEETNTNEIEYNMVTEETDNTHLDEGRTFGNEGIINENGNKKTEVNLNKEEIQADGHEDEEFICNLNDSIIVRYFQRKTWKYYVGFIENIESKDGNNYYKVKFLKTVKISSGSVKFVVQRKLDIDIVPNISVVKKVHLIQREETSKEYYLKDDNDIVFFTE